MESATEKTMSAADERGADGLVPTPLRQAMEIDQAGVHEMIGEPASRDPDVRDRLAVVIWAVYCATEPLTFADLSRRFGVTTERVRQLHAHALRLMRHPTRAHAVRSVVRPDTRLWHAIWHGCSS